MPALLGVFAFEAFDGLFLVPDFAARRAGRDVDRDGVVQKWQSRQVGDDAGPGALRPAREREDAMKMPVEIKPAVRLSDRLAVPAIFLDGQRRVEPRGRIFVRPAREARIE